MPIVVNQVNLLLKRGSKATQFDFEIIKLLLSSLNTYKIWTILDVALVATDLSDLFRPTSLGYFASIGQKKVREFRFNRCSRWNFHRRRLCLKTAYLILPELKLFLFDSVLECCVR